MILQTQLDRIELTSEQSIPRSLKNRFSQVLRRRMSTSAIDFWYECLIRLSRTLVWVYTQENTCLVFALTRTVKTFEKYPQRTGLSSSSASRKDIQRSNSSYLLCLTVTLTSGIVVGCVDRSSSSESKRFSVSWTGGDVTSGIIGSSTFWSVSTQTSFVEIGCSSSFDSSDQDADTF